MFDFQDDLIFPVRAVPKAGPWPPDALRLSLMTPDNDVLQGIHIPAEDERSESTLILGFGGNAWNGQDVAEYLHELYPNTDVVTFHYRGYPPSTGSPSASALLSDAPLVFDLAVERLKPRRTIAVGFSIGSGVAAILSTKRRVDGLILVTPFDSLKALAQSMFPWVPIGPFFKHEIDCSEAFAGNHVPTAIIAAEQDEIVPPERTQALRKIIGKLVSDRSIAAAGHNDIYARSEFQAAMREALEAVSR